MDQGTAWISGSTQCPAGNGCKGTLVQGSVAGPTSFCSHAHSVSSGLLILVQERPITPVYREVKDTLKAPGVDYSHCIEKHEQDTKHRSSGGNGCSIGNEKSSPCSSLCGGVMLLHDTADVVGVRVVDVLRTSTTGRLCSQQGWPRNSHLMS